MECWVLLKALIWALLIRNSYFPTFRYHFLSTKSTDYQKVQKVALFGYKTGGGLLWPSPCSSCSSCSSCPSWSSCCGLPLVLLTLNGRLMWCLLGGLATTSTYCTMPPTLCDAHTRPSNGHRHNSVIERTPIDLMPDCWNHLILHNACQANIYIMWNLVDISTMSHLIYARSGYLDATIYILKCKIYFASYPIIFCDTPY